MDFAALPPEINSARMYAGAGSGPMMSAAAAFSGLAAELHSTASSYESVITTLTGDEWTGPSSAAMAAAAAPYVMWMSSTAAQLQHAATQATASAAAYEAAFSMTVPPPVIAANRSLLMSLVATNVLGQNTPAIAATEAHYGEMWAQDAAAMYGYAGSSASAGTLTPLTSPAPTTNPAGQAAAVSQVSGAAGTQAGLSGVISTVQNAVQGLASPLAGSTGLSAAALPGGIGGLLGNSVVGASFNAVLDSVAWNGFAGISASVTASAGQNSAQGGGGAGVLVSGGMGGTLLAGAVAPAGSAGFGGAPPVAGLGQASTVGKLSVPPSWSAATPASSAAAAPLQGSGWTAGADSEPATTSTAGMPAMASAGRGGSSGPRYGFKPKMIQRPVFAG